MPLHPGIPITSDPSAPAALAMEQAPVDWTSWAGSPSLGVSPQAAMRGQPPPMSWWHRRSIPQVPTPVQPLPVWIQSRPYDRGAAAFAPHFGTIPISPIGAGILSPYKLPVIAGPGARYQHGAIWFDVQTVPTSLRMSPTMPMESVAALLATSHVSAMYPTTG